MIQPLLKRAAIIIAAIEIAYLAAFNLALNTAFTQDLINKIRDDKFNVHWDSAWTAYPFRIHANGVAANGQTRGQQWQFESPKASVSISLLPLIFKTVKLSNVVAKDITYLQRPRPKVDKDYSHIRNYFPSIQGRQLEIEPPKLLAQKNNRKGWTIKLNNMHASGDHTLWVYQAQVDFKGEVTADLSVITHGGPLRLSHGKMDLELKSIVLNGNHDVTQTGHIKGKVELLPFIVKQNLGLKSLAFMNLDVELDTYVKNLSFLDIYLNTFNGMKLQGAGQVQGRLILNQGKLLAKSDLSVTADSLELQILDYQLKGDGSIKIQVPKIKPNQFEEDVQLSIVFDHLDAFYLNHVDEKQPQAILSGNGFIINGVGTNNIIPLADSRPQTKSMTLSLSLLQVPDLSVFQHFLPLKWAIKLHGGHGELQGHISFKPASFSSDIRLSSQAADVGLNDFRFNTNLDLALILDSPSIKTGQVDLTGTYLKIKDAEVSNKQHKSTPWQGLISIDKGALQLNLEPSSSGASAASHLLQAFKEHDIGSLIATADGTLKISGDISDLRWINLLLKNPYDLVINGKGELNSNIMVKSGWFAKGSELRITPQDMSVEILDYVINGDGSVAIKVTNGGKFPNMALVIELNEAQLKRKLDDQTYIEGVDILLQAEARGVKFNKQNEDMQLHLQIPAAQIQNMSVYNQYLPENAPLYILSGQAGLIVDILLLPDDAVGFLKLNAQNLTALIDDQEISAELKADIKIASGTPKEMHFDISGSTLRLDKVQVIGNTASFKDNDWATTVHFNKANTIWKKPIQLDVGADIYMSDSIPLVSMLVNHIGKGSRFKKALIIDDVKGKINLQIDNNQILIPYAFADSDKLDVGAKAIINSASRSGMVYVRYKALKALLKIDNGEHNIDVFKAKEKFNAYRPVMK